MIIQMRGGSKSALNTENPLLKRREIAAEIDTGKLKVGDGVHSWNDLPYASGDIDWPESDNNVYVIKNGAFVNALLVDKPSEWNPTISDEEIFLTLDEDMAPYQLKGQNVVVNL